MKLRACKEWYDLTPEQKKEICNGCGPASAMIDLVPDTIYGLKICEACDRHDCAYHFGKTIKDKHKADMQFLVNLLILVNRGNFWLRFLRRRRALKYYEAVREGGDKAFWSGKESKGE